MREAALALDTHSFASRVNVAAFGLSLLASFLLFAIFGSATALELLVIVCGAVALLAYPEFALAAFLVVGDVKGDDRVAALFPCDLTLAVGVVVILGVLINFARKKRIAPLPPVYFLFLPLIAIMTASLVYTPVFSAGLEKLGLFVTVTAIAIVAPFFVLSHPYAMKRFLWAFGCAAYVICLISLAGLGGTDRLASPSDNTIGLGRVACVLATVIWFAFIPGATLRRRLLGYALLSVPLIAMIGSGSRGSAIAFAALILATVFFNRRLVLDIAALAFVATLALPLIDIPQASFRYLGSLFGAQTLGGLLDFRADLLEYGWQLLKQHPLIGAGIGGFRYSSPNPGLYKWPHDIFIELACELGIPAALIGFALFGSAIRESIRQLRDTVSPYFTFSMIAATLLWIGIVAAVTTGNINSDRSIWLFISLVFVIRTYRLERSEYVVIQTRPTVPGTLVPADLRNPT